MSKVELLKIPFLGRKTLNELLKVIEEIQTQSLPAENVLPTPPSQPKPLPFDGNVLALLEDLIIRLPERDQIILFERHLISPTPWRELAQRFQISWQRVTQLAQRAERSLLWHWRFNPVIAAAEKQLAGFPDGYVPNSGDCKALDGDLEKIREFRNLLDWVSDRAIRSVIAFDYTTNRWHLTARKPARSREKRWRRFAVRTPKHDGKREWNVYIVRCSNKTYYTGITRNVKKRVKQHNSGRGASYTAMYRPVHLVHHETEMLTLSEALARELQIKKFSRQEKEELIRRSGTLLLRVS